MFSKILIANRGEIALRIIRACKEMGIATVAVYSEADREAMHVSLADESYCIGPAPVSASYLNIGSILEVAVTTGCQAIHPGYGLLSENASFAELCGKCGLTFIGPLPETIRLMGDKEAARRTMKQAGVPVIEGSDLLQSPAGAAETAKKIGYPIMLKARAGGGGRGIRIVDGPEALDGAFRAASAEASSAFGDGALYMEKYLRPVKHIEVQILGDTAGNIVALGERDCSVQRANQKLLEESPAPALQDDARKKMTEAAVAAARAVGYVGAGTIEFLCSGGEFYFCEMNTRLQVEHPVTEMVTGIDLVKWQIRIAAGMPFPFTQDDLRVMGHAIECRINAEDPKRNYAPSAGTITMLHTPGGPWVRFDTAVYQGYTVPPYYDSLIGKLIVYAREREEAIRKMKSALCELVTEGIETNADLQLEILSDPAFISGEYTTDFLSGRGK
ncbi:MAG TPA: acetyl-CoA carboxylase biotin carboxylase subunit [Firmicutes bacterium]|nr:acetyl-CoA carboxylase biotin carboxylase subunit [Bacillota bacterium]